MSRSIHRTRRELEDLERGDAADSERRVRELTKLHNELQKKRRIKSQVRNLRRSSGEPVPTSVEAIPIREFEASRHNHYPATPNDIRAVLRSLPAGTSVGVLRTSEIPSGAA